MDLISTSTGIFPMPPFPRGHSSPYSVISHERPNFVASDQCKLLQTQ